MKKLLSILAAGLCAVSATAQPTLTAATTNPAIGDVYTRYQVSPAPSPGSAGANSNWDYSAITSSGNQDLTYISCSSDPNCASFPGTTIVGVETNNSNKGYMI